MEPLYWICEFESAFRSDLSRFHGIRANELDNELTSEEFLTYADNMLNYEGASTHSIERYQEEQKKHKPGLRTHKGQEAPRTISAEEAMRMAE